MAQQISEHHKDNPYVLIPVAVFKKPGSFKGLSSKLWGKDVSGALDANGVTNKIFGQGTRNCAVVILGPEGEPLWHGSDLTKGGYSYRRPGNPRVPYADLKDHVEPHLDKGLLGGLKVPVALRPVAKAIKTGSLGAARLMLKRAPNAGDMGEFKKTVLERLEALRAGKRALFDGLVAADRKWEAYKVGASYARCFPKAKDVSEVKRTVRSMKHKSPVKENLTAKLNFVRFAALAYGSKSTSRTVPQAKLALAQLAARYPKTEFGEYAAELSK